MSTHFPPQFFAANRQKLYEQLEPKSVLVLTAWTAMQRSLDQAYAFEQEPNFWYLTGVERPDWLLVVDVDERREWLVAPYVATVHQIFDGSLSPEEAQSVSGINQVVSKREGLNLLRQLLSHKKTAYTLKPANLTFYGFQPNPSQHKLMRKLQNVKVEDVRLALTRQRACKQPLEVEALQQAIDATSEAIKTVVTKLPELRAENEVDAVLSYEFRRRGLEHGFDPIVAAGKHTTTLHYEKGNAVFAADDWLLLDIGARANHYCADIARTIPMGNITDRQMELYKSLQKDQQKIIDLMAPGLDIKEYAEQAEQILYESQVRLGLLGKNAGRRDLYKNMPHAISHGLGYDVHDPLGQPETLQPGMVLTAEIGLYLWGESFGIRLEDDILITEKGRRNMSAALPIDLQELGAR